MRRDEFLAALVLSSIAAEPAIACGPPPPSIVAGGAAVMLHAPVVLSLLALSIVLGHVGAPKARWPRRRMTVAAAGLFAMVSALGFLAVLACDLLGYLLISLDVNQPAYALFNVGMILVLAMAILPALVTPALMCRSGRRRAAGLIQEASREWWTPPLVAGLVLGALALCGVAKHSLFILVTPLLLLTPAALPFVAWRRARTAAATTDARQLRLLPMTAGQAAHCPVCGSGLLGAAVQCSRCATPHHQDCFEYNGGCGLYGCRG
ncbi:MAG: hypothetical protein HY816_03190 [Candidatus Wallbacteria bacterium]|nr:hypothetical protein [Candidatus Wallbacteria bacterium]